MYLRVMIMFTWLAAGAMALGTGLHIALASEPEAVTVVTPEPAIVEELEPGTVPMGKFRVSFYCTCSKCCKQWSRYKRTATGMIADHRKNIIAVDPRVIPMHSSVYIDGLGWFQAEDKGKAIKGRRIDVLVASHWRAKNLGVKRMHVEMEKAE